MRIRILAVIAISVLSACALQSAPVSWTPQLEAATQQNFELEGEWRFTARSGAEFGRRCDILFDADGTYRKSCRPPVEETGDWNRVGEWDGHTMRIRLHDRVNMIEKRPIDDAEVTVVVESPEHDVITIDGERFERQ